MNTIRIPPVGRVGSGPIRGLAHGLVDGSQPAAGGGRVHVTSPAAACRSVSAGCGARAVHSIWFEILGEHGFPTFFVWVGINIAGALYARRIIKQATGVPGLEWCVNFAKMAQVSMIAYLTGGSFLSLCYWDYYFTILVTVAAIYQHVTATVGSVSERRRAIIALPPRLAVSR